MVLCNQAPKEETTELFIIATYADRTQALEHQYQGNLQKRGISDRN